jgi:hypothetical protein
MFTGDIAIRELAWDAKNERWVINTSFGVESKGSNPVGVTSGYRLYATPYVK